MRSPIALALIAALGVGLALPPAPVLAQDGTSMSIRTGSSSIGGAFGVRLAVYDARSFELAWNRIPSAATYRVQVGSRTVQENGAVSRYVSGVSLAGGFDYTLTALDRSGSVLATQRFRVQPASATQLVASGAAAPSTPAAPDRGPGRPRDTPQAPMNLRAELYSSTAGEVFWNRVTGVTLSYEVRVGGQVAATTNGTSYFIGNRPGLSGTAVEVVVIQPSGGRSSASSVTLGGGAAPTAPTNPMAPTVPPAGTVSLLDPVGSGSPLSGENYLSFLPAFYEVVDATPLEDAYARILPIADGLRAALDGEANGFVAESAGADGTTFACPEGGRARVFPEPSRPAGQTSIAFDACRVDGATLDGAVFENRSPSLAVFDTVGRSAPGTTLTYTSADGTRLVIQGRRFDFTPDPAGSGSARRSLEWSAGWTLRSDSRELTVQDQTTLLTDPGPGAGDELRTSLSMRGNLTSGRTIDVVTLNPLRASETTGRYVEGQVLLRDPSEEQLNLSLTEGGTNEVRVRFDTAGRVGERLVAQGDGSDTGFRRLDP